MPSAAISARADFCGFNCADQIIKLVRLFIDEVPVEIMTEEIKPGHFGLHSPCVNLQLLRPRKVAATNARSVLAAIVPLF
ncbi:hypothetical protein DTW90_21660 [Neorhizobium sp. P12A]|nr:hypothetical protein DTW90_21660 [Neorhizobium sp. P12A]TCR64342.1 hypothetical protein EV561_1666 [Rhizobium sp. BK376]